MLCERQCQEIEKKNHSWEKIFPKDTSDKAVLNRELDRVFKTSLENAYLTKFQTSYTNSFGTENGYLTGATTQAILDKYIAMYNANKEEYEIDSASFYKNVVDTSNRKNYVFYGYSEDIIEVHHILIKFANDSSEYENDDCIGSPPAFAIIMVFCTRLSAASKKLSSG